MKTSVIEVRDMLSVLSVQGVEERIGEVPGVESVTVNYAAGSATVRHDETRLNIADIKSAVRQAEYESAAASPAAGHEGHSPAHSPAKAETTAVPEAAAPAGEGAKDKATPGAPPMATLAPAAPKSPPAAASTSSAPEPGPGAAVDPPGGGAPADHAEHDKAPPKMA